MACNHELQAQGKSYPRTCAECGFGPCKKGYAMRPGIKSVWLLWAQYSDKSGETMIRVFDNEAAAMQAKAIADAASPTMELRITEIPFQASI